MRKAHAVHPVTALQIEYSLMERDPEKNGVVEVVKRWELGLCLGAGKEKVISLKGRRPDNARPARPIFDRFSIGKPGSKYADRCVTETSCCPGASNACASCISIPPGLEVIYCSNSRYTQPGSSQ
jgi:hypothetical protein